MNQGGPGGRDTHDKNNVPAHLKDLDAEELPENQRKVILSEIDMFRERSVKKAAERAAQDEARRAAPSQPSYNQAQQNRGWSARAPPPSGQSPSTSAAAAADPQSYNKPIDFVATGAPSNGAQSLNADGRSVPAALPEIDDAERERERAERAAREAEHIFRDVSGRALVDGNVHSLRLKSNSENVVTKGESAHGYLRLSGSAHARGNRLIKKSEIVRL